MDNPGYYIDLNTFSLTKLKWLLEKTRSLPSQQILQVELDERFVCLEEHGIQNLGQLQKALKTKKDVSSFAEQTGLPVEYLTVLRREVNGYQPKPINLKDFPGVNLEVIDKLRQVGIKNTIHLFPWVVTPKARQEFATQHLIEYHDILELTKLTDVARMKWVGPKFARLLIESPYDSVEKVRNANFKELYRSLVRINAEGEYYKGNFGLDDMEIWVTVVVQEVPIAIEYEV
jgi:hypothetical protein